jgi:SOS-response transcriptional repressor LexA
MSTVAPLFSEGEMIFVNPDLEGKPGDYVIAYRPGGHPDTMLLRQVKPIGSQCMFHPLNRKYEDLPVTNQDEVWEPKKDDQRKTINETCQQPTRRIL